jgi:hypothetical protein
VDKESEPHVVTESPTRKECGDSDFRHMRSSANSCYTDLPPVKKKRWRQDERDPSQWASLSNEKLPSTKIFKALETHDAGKPGINFVAFRPSFVKHCCVAGSGSPSPTPPSPEENIKETPRAPWNGCSKVSTGAFNALTKLGKARTGSNGKTHRDCQKIRLCSEEHRFEHTGLFIVSITGRNG